MNTSEIMEDMPDFLHPGWRAKIGSHVFSPDEIIAFAKKYDPQPFHLSQEAASKSVFGALCASGWHTASTWMRVQRDYMEMRLSEIRNNGQPLPEYGPSPGFKNLRWLKPVFAGETISFYNETVSCRPSRSKPGWFIVSGKQQADNEKGEKVLEFESSAFVKFPA